MRFRTAIDQMLDFKLDNNIEIILNLLTLLCTIPWENYYLILNTLINSVNTIMITNFVIAVCTYC